MVPSLVSCCLQLLVPFADEIELPVTLRLRPHDTLLDDLIPDPAELDPKLWAVLIQVYDALPPYLRTLTLHLSSPQVSLLQNLPPTPHFSLITLLTLSGCADLKDESITLFKGLHTLVGLDASCTTLTPHAVYTLGAILQRNHGDNAVRRHRGPWELRILSLRNCGQINDDVYPYLNKFPLLAVVDLRGTRCTPPKDTSFKPCSLSTFHHPINLADSLTELQLVQPDLFLSKKPYMLKVDRIKLPQVHRRHVPDVAPQGAFVVIPANPYRPVDVGNTHELEFEKRKAEARDRYERNKDEWYERRVEMEEEYVFGFQNDGFPERSGEDSTSDEDSDTESRNEYTRPNVPTSPNRPRRLVTPRLHADDDVPAFRPGMSPYLRARDAQARRAPLSSRFGTPEIRTISRPNPIPEWRRPLILPSGISLASPPRTPNPTRDAVLRPIPPLDAVTSSSTTSFYSRPPPRMPRPKRLSLRAVEEEGNPALKLYREPPPYSTLSSAITGSSKRARASGDTKEHEQEAVADRPSGESLKQAAKVDQTSSRAERARHAMHLAVESRMSTVASSSKTPSNKRSDLVPDESVLKKRRSAIPSFESSFPPGAVNINTPVRARNPFRKSLPSQSALAGLMEPPAFDPRPHPVVESKAPSNKVAHRHSLSNTTLTIATTSPPRLKSSKSTTDLRSFDFSALSASASSTSSFTTTKVGYRPPPRPPSPPNTKPLVPISSIKIPILPEPLRKEVAAMEKAELDKIKRAAERKRKKREEEEEGDATDSDEAELKRALKRRASAAKVGAGTANRDADAAGMKEGKVGATAKPSTTPTTVGKGKGNAAAGKKGAFDWKGWAKK